MENLYRALQKLESSDSQHDWSEYEGTKYLSGPSADEIELLCNEFLITETGQVNYQNVKELRGRGYSVYPGEKDSFGWVTGCVETKVGVIVFG